MGLFGAVPGVPASLDSAFLGALIEIVRQARSFVAPGSDSLGRCECFLEAAFFDGMCEVWCSQLAIAVHGPVYSAMGFLA